MDFFPRGLQPAIQEAWRSLPIVVLEGLRVVGKTTLAQDVVAADRYFTLADPSTLERARSDPLGWLEGLPSGAAVDEAQLVPGITLAAKQVVDTRGGRAGQFLLTGSSRLSRTELGGSDALAGRARRLRVEPFAQCEIERAPRDVITALFDGDPLRWIVEPTRHGDLVRRFAGGGLPTIRALDPDTRTSTLDQYAKDLFGGDIYSAGRRDVGGILRLFGHLAATSGYSEFKARIAGSLEVSDATLRGYLTALMDVFLVDPVEAYGTNPKKRITDKRRLFVTDPAFVAAALRLPERDGLFGAEHGPFLETFTANELRRLVGWTTSGRVRIMHWRRAERDEVDLVLERSDGKVLAIEVKAARSLQAKTGRGIEAFRLEYPDEFHRGFVLHAGDHVASLGNNVWAVPFSALWTIGDEVAVPLEERLIRAVTAIRRRATNERTDPDMDHHDEAWRLFSRAAEHLALIEKSVRQLRTYDTYWHVPTGIAVPSGGLGPEARRAGWTPRPPGVSWTYRVGLDVGADRGTCKIGLTADLTNATIEWSLRCDGAYADEFDGPFTTGTEDAAYSLVDARLGQLADALPAIIEAIT